MKNNFLITFLFFILVLITACEKDIGRLGSPSFTSQYGLPLAFGSLNFNDIVKDDNNLISVNSDSSLAINLSKDFLEFQLGGLLACKESLSKKFNLGIVNQLILGFYVPNQELEVDISNVFNNPLSKLTEIETNSGTLNFTLTNKLQIPVQNIQLLLPRVASSSSNFQTAQYGTIQPGQSQTISFDLAQLKINLRGKQLDKFNSIFCQLIVDSTTNSGDFLEYNLLTDSLLLTAEIKNPILNKGIGNFGTFESTETNSIDLFSNNLYNNIIDGSFLLSKANIDLLVDNTGGLPYEMKLDLTTKNSKDNSEIKLSPTPTFQLIKAKENPLSADPANNRIINNSQGYNLNETLSNFPEKLNYSLMFKNGSTSNIDEFVYSESKLKIRMDVQIPLNVKFNALTLQDTFNFGFSNAQIEADFARNNTINNQGNIILKTTNGFPYDFFFTAVLLNDNDEIIDTLAENVEVKAGMVNSTTNKVDQSIITINKIPFNNDTYRLYKQAKKIKVRYAIDSKTNNKNYPILSNYQLDLKINGELTIKVGEE